MVDDLGHGASLGVPRQVDGVHHSHTTRPLRSTGRSANAAGQDGSSLIEVIIAVFLVSLVVLGLATAFISLMRINRANAEQQRVDHAVDNVAEQLKATTYEATGTPAQRITAYETGLGLAATPSGEPTVRITRVECRVRSAAPSADTYSACTATDTGTQRITIRGEFRDRSRQAQIVVRNR